MEIICVDEYTEKVHEKPSHLILSIRALSPLRWNGDPKIHFECHCGDFTIFISPFRAQCHLFKVDNATTRCSGILPSDLSCSSVVFHPPRDNQIIKDLKLFNSHSLRPVTRSQHQTSVKLWLTTSPADTWRYLLLLLNPSQNGPLE